MLSISDMTYKGSSVFSVTPSMVLEHDSTFVCRWCMSMYARQDPMHFCQKQKVLRGDRPHSFRSNIEGSARRHLAIAWTTHERRDRSPKCSVTSCSVEDDRNTRHLSTSETRGGPESGSLQFRCMTFSVNVVGAFRTYVGVRQWLGCRDHHV